MTTSESQTIIDSWDYLCYVKNTKRNKVTNSESFISSGVYNPSYQGIMRIGERVSVLDSTYDLVEYTVLVLKPNIRRLYTGPFAPTSVSLNVYLSTLVLNAGKTFASMTLKLWANSSYIGWSSSTSASYNDIVNYYIPFDLVPSTYSSATYEREVDVANYGTNVLFETLPTILYSFMGEYSIGFAITGVDGYADVFNIDYSMNNLRPTFEIMQTIPYRSYHYCDLDLEIIGKSLAIGVCRNKNGEIVTGSQTEIAIFNLGGNNLIGSGSSNLNGEFRIAIDCKTNNQILVTFVNEGEDIDGCEIMQAFGSSSSSSSVSSSSSSLSNSSSSSFSSS